jgi:hypothetical protein
VCGLTDRVDSAPAPVKSFFLPLRVETLRAASPLSSLELTFDADRNQLFTAWNAIANLTGKVKVTIRAESEKGFDKAKLQNGVLEPLREADLIE